MSDPGKKTRTLIVVILDESGSMGIEKREVITGYNTFLRSQIELEQDEARLVLIKFNNSVTVAHAPTALCDVPLLDATGYSPAGFTALYDAVAEGIRLGAATVRPDERVLVIIMTDGLENASKKTKASNVKNMMTDKERLGNWTFAYIGKNPDEWSKTSGQSNSAPYDFNQPSQNFALAAAATTVYRKAADSQNTNTFLSQELFTDSQQ